MPDGTGSGTRIVLESGGDNSVLASSDNRVGLPPSYGPGIAASLGQGVVNIRSYDRLDGNRVVDTQGEGTAFVNLFPRR